MTMQPGTFNRVDKKRNYKTRAVLQGPKRSLIRERSVQCIMFFLVQKGHAPAVVVFVRKQ